MVECEYCGKDVKSRGYKNHVRMSGPPHGAQGEMPAEDETSDTDESASQDADADSNGDVTDVSPEEFEASQEPVSASEEKEDSGNGNDLPFDPSDDDALPIDPNEKLVIVENGEMVEYYASEGDYLLITENGPVLYAEQTGELYEVITE